MRCEYLVEEQLASTYASFLSHPPAFDEIVQGITTATIVDGFTIVCTVVKELDVEDEALPICTAILTVRVQKGKGEDSLPKAPNAAGAIELCFQKSITK
jgi:hypothetical protein